MTKNQNRAVVELTNDLICVGTIDKLTWRNHPLMNIHLTDVQYIAVSSEAGEIIHAEATATHVVKPSAISAM